MILRQLAAVLLMTLVLTSSQPTQQPPAAEQQTSAADQPPAAVSFLQPSAAGQLSALLSPLVEGAVSRAQSGWQLVQLAGRLERLQAGADAG